LEQDELPVMTFPNEKRINTEIFIDETVVKWMVGSKMTSK